MAEQSLRASIAPQILWSYYHDNQIYQDLVFALWYLLPIPVFYNLSYTFVSLCQVDSTAFLLVFNFHSFIWNPAGS